ncbi:MAG: saccharopine dehydrogenase NADP-binding domain-containing protein [Alphaproteobacteria bacterium]|nr:saccharopine dehydrogenase NADP-binding domain-containing protein [Rhodospirillales bacterium]MCW9046251.1 saccharopine dehydrogenase NADP-binding domain-containing protein [Alphaproteobacteria bacterium]
MSKTALQDSDKILIVGGYGQVGLSIAERLAPHFPCRIIIAGRNLIKAQFTATRIGNGVTARSIDIFAARATDALDNVAIVVVCLDQTDTEFVQHCLSRGIHYVDISAEYSFLSEVDKLDTLAQAAGAKAILSVGTSPGLTNMLAERVKTKMGQVDQIDILLELGLGDHHGKAAVEWMLDNLDAEYEVMVEGKPTAVRSFGEVTNIHLLGEQKTSPAFRFNFSDQHTIVRTLGLASTSTWIRFENRLTTWMFAKLSIAGLGRLLRRPLLRKIAVWLLMNIHIGTNICAVAARGTGKNGTQTLSIVGRKEALMTAIITVETVRQMVKESFPAGVFHSDQVVDLDNVILALRTELPDLVTDV